jgi:hypothetical protein
VQWRARGVSAQICRLALRIPAPSRTVHALGGPRHAPSLARHSGRLRPGRAGHGGANLYVHDPEGEKRETIMMEWREALLD